jgi:hypothetical protein
LTVKYFAVACSTLPIRIDRECTITASPTAKFAIHSDSESGFISLPLARLHMEQIDRQRWQAIQPHRQIPAPLSLNSCVGIRGESVTSYVHPIAPYRRASFAANLSARSKYPGTRMQPR